MASNRDEHNMVRRPPAKTLSGFENINYEIGMSENGILFKMIDCTGGGQVSQLPVYLSDILTCLRGERPDSKLGFSSGVFKRLFADRNIDSNNNRAFLAAILRSEGLIEALYPEKQAETNFTAEHGPNSAKFKHRLSIFLDGFEESLINVLEAEKSKNIESNLYFNG